MVNSGKKSQAIRIQKVFPEHESLHERLFQYSNRIIPFQHPVIKPVLRPFITQFVRFLFFASIHVPYPCYIKSPNIHVGCQKQVPESVQAIGRNAVVPVYKPDIFPLGLLQPCVPGFTKASVRLIHNMQVSVYRYKALHHIHAIVRSAVIHHNDFHSFRILRKYALKKFPNVCLNIIHGDNDG